MSTATIAGTITFNVTAGGPSASTVLGAPTITPSSTTGPQVTYTESSSNSYSVPTGGPTTIPLGTIADADLVYIGADQDVTITLVPTSTINLTADGFILLSGASITAITVDADAVTATVSVVILGA